MLNNYSVLKNSSRNQSLASRNKSSKKARRFLLIEQPIKRIITFDYFHQLVWQYDILICLNRIQKLLKLPTWISEVSCLNSSNWFATWCISSDEKWSNNAIFKHSSLSWRSLDKGIAYRSVLMWWIPKGSCIYCRSLLNVISWESGDL